MDIWLCSLRARWLSPDLSTITLPDTQADRLIGSPDLDYLKWMVFVSKDARILPKMGVLLKIGPATTIPILRSNLTDTSVVHWIPLRLTIRGRSRHRIDASKIFICSANYDIWMQTRWLMFIVTWEQYRYFHPLTMPLQRNLNVINACNGSIRCRDIE